MSHNFPKFQHLLLVCLMTAITGVAEAGSVQLSTYYPSPFGMYDRLRLVPRTTITAPPPCNPGTLYYETGVGLRLCDESSSWGSLGGGVWSQTGNSIYPMDFATANVGIGTNTPDEELHVAQTVGNVALRLGDFGTNDWDLIRSVGNDSIPSGNFAIKMLGAANPSITVDTIGNVGIGTTTPNNTLQISGLINFDDARFSTSIGKSAGVVNTGNYNSFFGYQAGFANTTGVQNTFVGTSSGNANTTGNYNTATGTAALRYNTTGSNNTANGYSALYSNTTGLGNTASGYYALTNNTTGINNTAGGFQALYFNTIGFQNTAIGREALLNNTTGNNNIALGYAAGDNITTGYGNIIIGPGIDAPSATANNQLSIGNLIFGTGLDGTGTTISTGNIGIGTTNPGTNRLEVVGGPIKATGGFILETRTTNPATPVTGQMWLCTDTGDTMPCNGI